MDTLEALQSGQLSGHTHLRLSEHLTQFPNEILELADSLEFLDLSNNHLQHLPDSFSQLRKLRIVFFNNNQFEAFPAVLSTCPNLSMVGFKNNSIATIGNDDLSPTIRWLILTNNQLEALPTEIGRLTKLQKLMLAGNRLQSLPTELTHCKNLELIRLSANQLSQFPSELLTLPRLSWLAYAGNPFCEAHLSSSNASRERSLPIIHWCELDIGDSLGQGASGVIYEGQWHPTDSQGGSCAPQNVAIKVFKGDITSDGSPLDEMQACIAAGNHPNLVTVLGKLDGHPEEKAGLVFAMLPPSYTTLGNPPSLESCTRDTYPDDTLFPLSRILAIATGVAAAAAHLHDHGIMHGDLYAHNVLITDEGTSILSDFGAASFYDATHKVIDNHLEMLDVRAFGCLLEELLDRCISDQIAGSNDATLLNRLRHLQVDCMSPVLAQRPRFKTICDGLSRMTP
ncbi:MAG: leucine-rich repeat-containing protein kinase family protein [Cyanobacteria bacterium J06633_2]